MPFGMAARETDKERHKKTDRWLWNQHNQKSSLQKIKYKILNTDMKNEKNS